uniref:Plastid-encoded RNA polymerase subunit alpha n=1 Tax=Polytoma uvella TaxID=40532 RepID=A0A1L2M5E0_9CHLO|nr:alpha subunit of RNA polymerase [Polytoma uvella]
MNKILISCKEARIESNRSLYSCFELSAFSKSDSLTVANTLRRTLLSECTGVAIVSALIENVQHEYSTLPGVRDSVLDILLNLKELVLKKVKVSTSSILTLDSAKLYSAGVQGYLKTKGPGVIRAKDLRLPSFIQCVDPEQYIATLGDDGFLNMQFVIQESSNVRYTQKNILPLGNETLLSARRLYINAVFNPVTKVNFILKDSNKRYIKKEAGSTSSILNLVKDAYLVKDAGSTSSILNLVKDADLANDAGSTSSILDLVNDADFYDYVGLINDDDLEDYAYLLKEAGSTSSILDLVNDDDLANDAGSTSSFLSLVNDLVNGLKDDADYAANSDADNDADSDADNDADSDADNDADNDADSDADYDADNDAYDYADYDADYDADIDADFRDDFNLLKEAGSTSSFLSLVNVLVNGVIDYVDNDAYDGADYDTDYDADNDTYDDADYDAYYDAYNDAYDDADSDADSDADNDAYDYADSDADYDADNDAYDYADYDADSDADNDADSDADNDADLVFEYSEDRPSQYNETKTKTNVGVTQRFLAGDTDILLEVWTNGSVHPREALSSAFLHLSYLFSITH